MVVVRYVVVFSVYRNYLWLGDSKGDDHLGHYLVQLIVGRLLILAPPTTHEASIPIRCRSRCAVIARLDARLEKSSVRDWGCRNFRL